MPAAVRSPALEEHEHVAGEFQDAPVIVAGARDIGVPGYDIYCAAERVTDVVAALVGAGAHDVDAEAWDTLRIEAGLPLFGVDMDTETIPLEAGIETRAISQTKGCYVGQEVIIRVLHRGGGRVVAPPGRPGPADGGRSRRTRRCQRPGTALHCRRQGRRSRDQRRAGRRRSRRMIALGYVHRDFAEPGTMLTVGVEPAIAATVATLPLVAMPTGARCVRGRRVTADRRRRRRRGGGRADGRWLVARRLEGTHLEGLWEFPGGKGEPGETLEACLVREMVEELGVAARVGRLRWSTRHDYPAKRVELHFFECAIDGEPQPLLGQELRWVSASELRVLPFPEADAGLVALLTRSVTQPRDIGQHRTAACAPSRRWRRNPSAPG